MRGTIYENKGLLKKKSQKNTKMTVLRNTLMNFQEVKSYKDALKYLNSFVNYEYYTNYFYDPNHFDLDRVKLLLRYLGNPHLKMGKIIHVAGTKGKGSVCAMISSILNEAGFKTGLYTSPHFYSLRERIKVNNEMISQKKLIELVNKIKPAVEKVKAVLTFFEVLTALAFLYFSRKKTDFSILEVGLGGRLDATNVITPLVCIITPIDLDHTQLLGNSLTKITYEKAGIIKERSIVITSIQKDEVMSVIEKVCHINKAKLLKILELTKWKKLKSTSYGQLFFLKSIYDSYKELYLPLIGRHQITNAIMAVITSELLDKQGWKIKKKSVKEGLKKVYWPGRIEVIKNNPLIVLDGAHNSASAKVLKNTIEEYLKYKNLVLIFSCCKDKDIDSIARELFPLARQIILTKTKFIRSAEPEEVAKMMKEFRQRIIIQKNLSKAIKHGVRISHNEDLICITGSLYIVGEARKTLRLHRIVNTSGLILKERRQRNEEKKEEVCA